MVNVYFTGLLALVALAASAQPSTAAELSTTPRPSIAPHPSTATSPSLAKTATSPSLAKTPASPSLAKSATSPSLAKTASLVKTATSPSLAKTASLAKTNTLPNWVGPKVGAAKDTACYRKTHLTKKCPPGYTFDNIATCWAECPIEYPVQCGMECIPQNKDCTLEVISKVNAVATVALNAATSGVFGELAKASKGVQQGVKCGQQLYAATNKVVGYAKELNVKFPNSTESQISYLLSKSDFAINDLTVAVTTCLGLPAPTGLEEATAVVNMVKKMLGKITGKGDDLLDTSTFLQVTADVGIDSSIQDLNKTGLDALKKLIDGGVTCGTDMKSVIDKVIKAVKELRAADKSSPAEAIRLAISNSDLFLKDIPALTSSCVPKNTSGAYMSRDDIRKTLQVIIDNIIDSSSNGGKPLTAGDYALKIAGMGLDAIASYDPTGLVDLAKEYIQPICGPTSFIGEVDDGALDKALGLRMIGQAFTSSSGSWTKAGSGNVTISFVSVDKEDVTVNVISGGKKIAEVAVKKGKTASWTKSIADLKDKTLYLDRWRPGFFGIAGTGGGSLLLWVPHSSEGGDLKLRAQLNVS